MQVESKEIYTLLENNQIKNAIPENIFGLTAKEKKFFASLVQINCERSFVNANIFSFSH